MKEKANYSEMLTQVVKQFEEELPEALTIEEVIEVGIEAWNLANDKNNLEEKLYKKELKKHKYDEVIDKMVTFKLDHFAEYNNTIVDFSTENDILQVKCRKTKDSFDDLMSKLINAKPTKN